MRYFVGFLVLLGVVLTNENQAYIQIFDFIDQSLTSPGNPMLVLTEDSDDLHTKPKVIQFDMWEFGYMVASNLYPIEAGEYSVSFQVHNQDVMTYFKEFGSFSVESGESVAIFVDEEISDLRLKGTLCHTGPIPKPGPDQAVVILCSANEKINVTKIDVTGYNLECKGCLADQPMTTDPVEDSVHFLINDTTNKWDVSLSTGALSLCDLTLKLGGGGVYTVVVKTAENINDNNPLGDKYECFVDTSAAPGNFWLALWLPLWLPILILV